MREIKSFSDQKNRLLPEEVAISSRIPLELLELYYPDNRDDICLRSTREIWTPSYDNTLYTTGHGEMAHMKIHLYWKENGEIDRREYYVGRKFQYYEDPPKITEFQDRGNLLQVEYVLPGEKPENKILTILKEDVGCGLDGYTRKRQLPYEKTYFISSLGGSGEEAWEPW